MCVDRVGKSIRLETDKIFTASAIPEQTFVQLPANSDLIFDVAKVHDDLSS
jgi:hypothetical protein